MRQETWKKRNDIQVKSLGNRKLKEEESLRIRGARNRRTFAGALSKNLPQESTTNWEGCPGEEGEGRGNGEKQTNWLPRIRTKVLFLEELTDGIA